MHYLDFEFLLMASPEVNMKKNDPGSCFLIQRPPCSYLPSSFVRRQGDTFRNSYPESYKAASSVSPLLCPIPSNALQLIFLNSILELVLTFLSYDESVSSFFDNLVTFHPLFSFVFSSIFQRLLLKTPLLWPPTKSASGSSIQRSPSNSALF